jgi:hypothetical protein
MGGSLLLSSGRWAALPLLLSCATIAKAADPAVQPADPPAEQAQRPEPPPPPSPGHPAPSNKWQFSTIGYIWFAGAWGKTDVIGPVEPVDLDLSFGKVLKAFKFAFMGAAEARHDRIVILGDLTFIHLDAKEGIGIRDPDFLDAELDSRTAEVTLLGGYRVVNDGPVSVDLLAGGRMNFFKTSLELEGPSRSAEGSVKKTWFDPIIATRVNAPLGGKWSASAYGDVGGIVTGSDITWQGVAAVDYQINHKMSLGAGWRYFKVNYDDGDFLYNVHQSGPLITFRTIL